MKIRLIVARDENNVIGNKGKLPWSCPQDLVEFKRKTVGCVVVMGRKTFESLKKPLPNRVNVVVTTNPKEDTGDVRYVSSVLEAIKIACMLGTDLWVIGGKQIYDLFYDYASEFHVTTIKGEHEGDVILDYDFESDEVQPDFEVTSVSVHEDFSITVFKPKHYMELDYDYMQQQWTYH